MSSVLRPADDAPSADWRATEYYVGVMHQCWVMLWLRCGCGARNGPSTGSGSEGNNGPVRKNQPSSPYILAFSSFFLQHADQSRKLP